MILQGIRRVGSLALLLAVAMPQPAHAYIGPGAGLGAIAVTVAFVLGIVLLLVGFVWYPLKRMMKSRKTGAGSAHTQVEPSKPE